MKKPNTRAAFVVVALAMITMAAWALPNVSAETGHESKLNETSAWAQVDGSEKQSISKGDVLAQADRLADGSCDRLSYSVGMRGDVKSIKTHINEDDCTLVVLDVVLNPQAEELKALIESDTAEDENASLMSGYQWEVQTRSEWQGLTGVSEVLTRSLASVRFWTASFSGGAEVYSGSNASYSCYAWGPPTNVWYVDSCSRVAYSLSGPYDIWSLTSGSFHHGIGGWDHTTTAEAAGLGWTSVPGMFSSTCGTSGGPPSPAHHECEQDWQLVSS